MCVCKRESFPMLHETIVRLTAVNANGMNSSDNTHVEQTQNNNKIFY